jgi:hypothetical protein
MPHRATRYSENVRLPPPMARATPIAIAMAMTAYTDDSMPLEVPASTTVAGPVSALSAISLTGPKCVPVKYSVRRLTSCARTRPTATAPKHFQPSLALSLPT